MTYNIGDPDHIGVHNQLTSDVQTAAAERGIDVDLPPQRNLGDDGHVKDHNLITDALAAVAAAGGGGGKVLQVVRASTGTKLTTSSQNFVDAGLSVTITPTDSSSKLILILIVSMTVEGTGMNQSYGNCIITDNQNTAVEGASHGAFGMRLDTNVVATHTQWGFASPNTTSPVTYKGRFSAFIASGRTVTLHHNQSRGQLYAIEVEEVKVSP